ncbi:hypothetical protein SLEP1_g40853 [Rubroshorea leprosula]|uniref:Uncharacterized protein n=1 Tax=Rubroshorea leprosula TaxID=152421 RepID=A0AAV5L4Q1_9ROSI|nr:hypothetical protein SLEP1_g40853 [Rubroshorea leprosula]
MRDPEPSSVEPSKQSDTLILENKGQTERPSGLGGVLIGIGEQVYPILLLIFFFLEVSAIGFIPFVGKALNFLLLSWMYAYYCFEYVVNMRLLLTFFYSCFYIGNGLKALKFHHRYKWNFSEVSLGNRLIFFESNWAFFAGFGNCV